MASAASAHDVPRLAERWKGVTSQDQTVVVGTTFQIVTSLICRQSIEITARRLAARNAEGLSTDEIYTLKASDLKRKPLTLADSKLLQERVLLSLRS